MSMFLPHLADAALHASVLVLFILALQTIIGSRLSPQWRTALWFLVVLRLAIPVFVPAPFSIYNVLPIPAASTLGIGMQTEIRGAPASDASARPLAPSAPSTWTFDTMAPCPGSPDAAALPATQATPPSAPQSPPSALPLSLAVMLLLGWMSGALLVMGAVVRASMRCGRIARRAEPAGMEITLVSQEAAQLMKARRPLPVRISEDPRCADIGPFLIGLLRPKVILPGSLARSASALDLRCVLMHEMAHRRCGDLHVNCLLAFLTAVHWFNPLVWIAFRNLRGERELLRDAMVLAHLQNDQRPHYARLLASFGGLSIPGRSVLPDPPALAATMASRVPSLHRRVSMSLHTPRTEHRLRTWIRYALITALGAVTLTGAAAHTSAPPATTEMEEGGPEATLLLDACAMPASSPATITLTDDAAHALLSPVIARVAEAPAEERWQVSIRMRSDFLGGPMAWPWDWAAAGHREDTVRGATAFVHVLSRRAVNSENQAAGAPTDAATWIASARPRPPQDYQSFDVPVLVSADGHAAELRSGHSVEVMLRHADDPAAEAIAVDFFDGLSLQVTMRRHAESGKHDIVLNGRFVEVDRARLPQSGPPLPSLLRQATINVTHRLTSDEVLMIMVPVETVTASAVRITEDPVHHRTQQEIITHPQPSNAGSALTERYIILFIEIDELGARKRTTLEEIMLEPC